MPSIDHEEVTITLQRIDWDIIIKAMNVAYKVTDIHPKFSQEDKKDVKFGLLRVQAHIKRNLEE